jgi:hypothetical protein
MKKILIILLALLVALFFVACPGDPDGGDAGDGGDGGDGGTETTINFILTNDIDTYPDDQLGLLVSTEDLVIVDAGTPTGYTAQPDVVAFEEIVHGIDYPDSSDPIEYDLGAATLDLELCLTYDELPHETDPNASGYYGDGFYYPIAEFDGYTFEAGNTYEISLDGITVQ